MSKGAIEDAEKADAKEGGESEGDKGGAKVLSFFRVFDLAFFAPGALLLVTIVWPYKERIMEQEKLVNMVTSLGGALVVGGFAVAVAFSLGLFVGAIARVLPLVDVGRVAYRRIHRWHSNYGERHELKHPEFKGAWFQKLQPGPRIDLALYFWYMRSTCANLAIAIFIEPLLLLYIYDCPCPLRRWAPGIAVCIVAAILLMIQAGEYDDAMRSAVGLDWRVPSAKRSSSGPHTPDR